MLFGNEAYTASRAQYAKGADLVTEELLQSARDSRSSALPEDASHDMIDAFWEKVYDYL